MSDAGELAREIREVLGDGDRMIEFSEFLVDKWAPEVRVTSTPMMGDDSAVSGETLGTAEVTFFKNLKRELPDYHIENFTVSVENGNVVLLREQHVGTLPDGTVHRSPTEMRFTVENGKIVQTHLTHNPADMAPFGEIMARARAGAEYRS